MSIFLEHTPVLDKIRMGMIEAQGRNVNPDYLIINKDIAEKLKIEAGVEVTDSAVLFGMKVRINDLLCPRDPICYDSSKNTLNRLYPYKMAGGA